jgi:hypothetical protein
MARYNRDPLVLVHRTFLHCLEPNFLMIHGICGVEAMLYVLKICCSFSAVAQNLHFVLLTPIFPSFSQFRFARAEIARCRHFIPVFSASSCIKINSW